MGAVEIVELFKSYGSARVIHGISIEIDDGQFVALVGPSGCGKSTLLRMIAGLEDVSGGEIFIDGEVVNDLPPKERDIAMVFQNYALYPHMTVAQNMGFSLHLQRVPRAQIKEKIDRAAEILGLEDLLHRQPRQLSGGQRQRVAMGRAIVRDPRVFLFDEPLSNLDAKLRVQMRTEIKELHQRLKTTTIYVTHDQIEAMTLADKIVVMNAGEIEQVGSPLDLYDDPQTLFVAGFIGSPSMNLIKGKVSSGELPTLDADGLILPLPRIPGLQEGSEVTLGFRPEHISINSGGIDSVVVVLEPTGSETQLIARAGGHNITAIFRDRLDLKPDQPVSISPDLKRAYVFDTTTGARLA